jgi:DNA processing protein
MPATPHARTLVALTLAGATPQVLRRLASYGAAPGVEPPAAVWARTDDLLGSLERSGTRVTALGEPGYPAALLELPDPPPFLLVRGERPADWARAVAVVAYARDVAGPPQAEAERAWLEASLDLVLPFEEDEDS